MPVHDATPDIQPDKHNTPYSEPEINALLHNNERKLAVARMDAFMDFIHDHNIDMEEEMLTEEQMTAWYAQEYRIISWYDSRRIAILALANRDGGDYTAS